MTDTPLPFQGPTSTPLMTGKELQTNPVLALVQGLATIWLSQATKKRIIDYIKEAGVDPGTQDYMQIDWHAETGPMVSLTSAGAEGLMAEADAWMLARMREPFSYTPDSEGDDMSLVDSIVDGLVQKLQRVLTTSFGPQGATKNLTRDWKEKGRPKWVGWVTDSEELMLRYRPRGLKNDKSRSTSGLTVKDSILQRYRGDGRIRGQSASSSNDPRVREEAFVEEATAHQAKLEAENPGWLVSGAWPV